VSFLKTPPESSIQRLGAIIFRLTLAQTCQPLGFFGFQRWRY
jgi:hypothetical protein